MKKNLAILLSSFVLVSLISCNEHQPVEKSKNDYSSIIESSQPSFSLDGSEQFIISSSDEASTSTPTSTSGVEETYYHVTFVNYDDSVLYEVDVLEGSNAEYKGETPTKEEDGEFTYEFIGWDIDLTSIQSDVTAVAQFEAKAIENWGPIHWFD